MTDVVSVRFKNKGKTYYFSPGELKIAKGDFVIVETAKGLEYAECTRGNHEVEDSAVVPPLRSVVRIATQEDTQRAEQNRKREAEAFAICRDKIAKHGLDMKLVDVEYNFEGSKILFFFTSEGRVDFRELVKDLASVFKTRIELRQLGVRDEARILCGLGICGRPFCCAQFLDDFQPVSIKMAKTQGLSLNPTKISGTCGRLMCCLKYEQDTYEELVKGVPKVDAFVETPLGKGSVTDVNLLRGTVRVRLEDSPDPTLRTFEAGEVTVLGGKAKRAEYLALKAEGKIEPTPPPRMKFEPVPPASSAPAAPAAKAELPEIKQRLENKPAHKPERGKDRRPDHNRGGKDRKPPIKFEGLKDRMHEHPAEQAAEVFAKEHKQGHKQHRPDHKHGKSEQHAEVRPESHTPAEGSAPKKKSGHYYNRHRPNRHGKGNRPDTTGTGQQ